MAKNQRTQEGATIQDPGAINNIEHNPAAGAQKNIDVGGHLIPLKIISGSTLAYTTDASTRRALDNLGVSLAVYNNAATMGSITLGEDNTVTSLAAGVTDAAGHVGIPCPPNSWTRISAGTQNWVIASAATLMVFVVDDHTQIKQEVATYKGN